MSYQEVSEQVDVLLKCSEHLTFAQEVINKLSISTELRNEFSQKIERIKQRQQDSNLYLGVVGEFSSGKSTFINALLKDELLKTSALVATAAATKIKYGTALNVNADFSDRRTSIKKTESSLKGDLSWLAGAEQMTPQHLIHTLTSEDSVASAVANITIEHPASFLSNGIVVIDTPGTNADNEAHGLITRKAIEHEVDLAIVVIPATMPLSQSLASFLSGPLKPFLHRCIFVVSRIDEIKRRERDDLVEDLRLRLADQLGIEHPIVYSCSAQVMLDILSGEESIPHSSEFFYEQFLSLENLIVNRLSQERILSISESLLRLLTQLFQQLNNKVQARWQAYAERQTEIEKNTIPDLSRFIQEQYSDCDKHLQTLISEYGAKTANCVDSHREIAKESMRKKLFGLSNEEELNIFLSSRAESLLTEEAAKVKTDLQPLTTRVSERAVTIGKTFDRKFSKAYKRLQSIGGNIESDINTRYDFKVNVSRITVSAQSLTKEIDSGDGTKMGVGATAGLAIGTVLLPGIGSLVGLAAGTWASKFFMPSLDERKQQLWQNLRPSIDTYFDTVRQQVRDSTTDYTRGLEASLKQRIDTYGQKYEVIVKEILNQQKDELDRLNKLQAAVQIDLNEIKKRQQTLANKQKQLAVVENL